MFSSQPMRCELIWWHDILEKMIAIILRIHICLLLSTCLICLFVDFKRIFQKKHFPQLDRNWTPLHFLWVFQARVPAMDGFWSKAEMDRGNPPSSFWRTTSTRPKTRWNAAWRKPVWLGARVERFTGAREFPLGRNWDNWGFLMGDLRNGWFIVENYHLVI